MPRSPSFPTMSAKGVRTLDRLAEFDAVDDEPGAGTADGAGLRTGIAGGIDEMADIKSEASAIGQELVGVGVGKPAVVVEELVLGVGDGDDLLIAVDLRLMRG